MAKVAMVNVSSGSEVDSPGFPRWNFSFVIIRRKKRIKQLELTARGIYPHTSPHGANAAQIRQVKGSKIIL